LTRWLHDYFLGIEGWKYLAILGILLGATLARHLCELALGRYLRGLMVRARLGGLEAAVGRADRALGFLTFSVIVFVTVPLLELPPRTEAVVRITARSLISIGGVWLAFRLLDVLFDFFASKTELTSSKLDDQLVPILRRTGKVFTAVVGGLFALQNMEVDVGSLLAGLGLGGLAFALAAKDTVANFFGSLVIFIDKPFTIGDRVQIEDHEGVVEEVGFRTTRVRTFHDSLLTVPNAMMTTAVVDNWGARRHRRYTTRLGITYDTPAEKVQAFCAGIRAVLAASPDTRKDFYLAELAGYGASSLDILVYCFFTATSWAGEMRARTHVNLELLRLAERLGVRFAFPTTSVHVESLAAPGATAVAQTTPSADELGELVRRFGPGGALARQRGIPLAADFEPAVPERGTPLAGLDEGDG
jgi:MscS family membrane protein